MDYSGRWFAQKLFHATAEEQRPKDYHGIDDLLERLIPMVTAMQEPMDHCGYVTAVR